MAAIITGTQSQRRALELYLSNGGDKTAAYSGSRDIGPTVTPRQIRKSAYNLFNTPTMKRLMAEADFQAKLQMERKLVAGMETALEKYGITKDKILGELAKIAFAQQTDVVSWGPDGVVVKDSSEIGDAASAVGEVSQTGGGKDPVSVKIKMLDKQQALIHIGREAFGMFSQKVDVSGKVGVAAIAKFVIEGR